MKILVSNLHAATTEIDLEQLFLQFGHIVSIKLVRGWDSSESRGIAVVEVGKRDAGEKAIKALNGVAYMEQQITVHEIRTPQTYQG